MYRNSKGWMDLIIETKLIYVIIAGFFVFGIYSLFIYLKWGKQCRTFATITNARKKNSGRNPMWEISYRYTDGQNRDHYGSGKLPIKNNYYVDGSIEIFYDLKNPTKSIPVETVDKMPMAIVIFFVIGIAYLFVLLYSMGYFSYSAVSGSDYTELRKNISVTDESGQEKVSIYLPDLFANVGADTDFPEIDKYIVNTESKDDDVEVAVLPIREICQGDMPKNGEYRSWDPGRSYYLRTKEGEAYEFEFDFWQDIDHSLDAVQKIEYSTEKKNENIVQCSDFKTEDTMVADLPCKTGSYYYHYKSEYWDEIRIKVTGVIQIGDDAVLSLTCDKSIDCNENFGFEDGTKETAVLEEKVKDILGKVQIFHKDSYDEITAPGPYSFQGKSFVDSEGTLWHLNAGKEIPDNMTIYKYRLSDSNSLGVITSLYGLILAEKFSYDWLRTDYLVNEEPAFLTGTDGNLIGYYLFQKGTNMYGIATTAFDTVKADIVFTLKGEKDSEHIGEILKEVFVLERME